MRTIFTLTIPVNAEGLQ